MRKSMVLVVLAILAALPAVTESFGHGLGGDVAPPLDLGGRDVTVSTQLEPADLSTEDTSDASMAVRFYDVDTDETFDNVTYQIEIWRSQDLIARNLFFDRDGQLDVDLRTEAGCAEPELWQCTKYFGSEHPTAPGALYAQGESKVVIQGPIFDKGGLYNIKVGITGATSARTILAEPLTYDTFISVADIQPFTIQTAHAEVQATIKTYYDKVSNIEYDESRESISFDMPFDWNPEYVELVQIVHEEIQIPKSFTTYSSDREYAGYIDGVRLGKRILIVDPYTYDDRNIIHFLVTKAELQRINTQLGAMHEQSGIMNFELVPEDNVQKNTAEFYLVDLEDIKRRTGGSIDLSWEAGSADTIPVEIAFFGSEGLLRNVQYGYKLVDHTTGTELINELGTGGVGVTATEGIDIITVDTARAGTYRLDVVLFGQGTAGLDFDDKYAGIGSAILEFGGGAPPPPDPIRTEDVVIPKWVRNIAGWWSEGKVKDSEFVSALGFLIEEEVIGLSAQRETNLDNNKSIPTWVRDTAGWWADGITDDRDFADSLEFLIQKGIIVVGGA